jgi:hypothetical protein
MDDLVKVLGIHWGAELVCVQIIVDMLSDFYLNFLPFFSVSNS